MIADQGEPDGLPRSARPFGYGLIGLLVACAAIGVEWWPLSSFRLFSSVRGQHQPGWEVVTVDRGGHERPVDWSALPAGYKGWYDVASLLPTMAEGERETAMRLWADAATANGADVSTIRVYRTARRVPTRNGAPATPVSRTLRYQLAVNGP